MESIASTVAVLFALVVYFTPSVIAYGRSHHNVVAITATNILLGWTLLGWIFSLIWSLTAVRE